MTWLQRFQVRHFFRHSTWIFPTFSLLAALLMVRITYALDLLLALENNLEPEALRTILGILAGSLFTVVVFVCSAILIAVQLASAQLTPRIIALVFRDPTTKLSLALFVFIFTFSLAVLIRVKTTVPLICASLSVYGFMLCLIVFLYLVDHLGRSLRPSGALRIVGLLGTRVIEEVYSRQHDESSQRRTDAEIGVAGNPSRILASDRNGAVLAFDVLGLRDLAHRTECVIEMVPQVGDFVTIGSPLFRIYGGKTELTADLLCHSVAIGQERTFQQDPTLAFRIMVDVASKALSPAINDPTTAVLALDQIHHILRNVGGRCLDDERVRDASGRLRLIYRTPDWDAFVHLAATEIRHFGAQSIQIARRLRAMLEDLIESLPRERVPLLQQELQLLDRSVKRFFPEPEDRALADVGDLQGVGGAQEESAPPNRTSS